MIPSAILALLVNSIGVAVWQRSEFGPLRTSIEGILKADNFASVTCSAFEPSAAKYQNPPLSFFEDGFITENAVQEHLAAFIVKGRLADLHELANLYTRRFPKPGDDADTQAQFEAYVKQVRNTLVADPIYGPILTADKADEMRQALRDLQQVVRQQFDTLSAERKSYFVDLFADLNRASQPILRVRRTSSLPIRVKLTREQLRQLVSLMSTREEFAQNLDRRLFLKTYDLERFLGSLHFDTKAQVFSTELVTQLIDYGEMVDDLQPEPAIWRLLRGLKELFEGQDDATVFLDSLLSTEQPSPSSLNLAATTASISETYAFLSYSSSDRGFVSRLAEDLEARGVRLWWDRQRDEGIQPAQDWERVLRTKLNEITHLVTVLTPRSVASDMVRAELQIAFAAKPRKVLVPLLAETLQANTMPMQLVPLQYLDFRDSVLYETRLKELTSLLSGIHL